MRRNLCRRVCLMLTMIALIAGSVVPLPGAASAKADGGLPTAAEIVQLLKDRHPNKGHPRILVTAADFDAARQLAVVPVTVDDNSVIVYPTDDAYVRDGLYADYNFGNGQQLETINDNTTNYTRQAFMKFRFSRCR